MAKKPEKDTPAVSTRFEIIPEISTRKINRERDQRVQWTTSFGMILSILLAISVIGNVYQMMSFGGFLFYGQDIRTGELTVLEPLPAESHIANATVGKPPLYTDEILAQMDAQEKEKAIFLNGLYRPEVMAARVQAINAGTILVAPVMEQAAAATAAAAAAAEQAAAASAPASAASEPAAQAPAPAATDPAAAKPLAPSSGSK
jgi:hypothetical protein